MTEERRVTLWVAYTHRNAVSEKASFQYWSEDISFSPLPPLAPKYDFAESTTTMLATCSKKGRVELCVMKSHIEKQSLSKLLSSFYVRVIPFSPWAPMLSQISLSRIHDNSISKLFQEGKGGILCDEVTHQKAISQKASSRYYLGKFPFSPWAHMG